MQTSKTMGMLAAMAVLLGTSIGAQATLLSSWTGTPYTGNYNIGYRFTPTSSITVDELGFVDVGGAPLDSSHVVALWQVVDDSEFGSGFALGSVTVKAGTASQLIDGFRYEWLSTPITLTAGTEYVLSASTYAGGDPYYYNSTDPTPYTLGLPVTMDGGQFGVNYYPNYPNYFPIPVGAPYTDVNLMAVPEPSILILLAAGGLVVWWRAKRA